VAAGGEKICIIPRWREKGKKDARPLSWLNSRNTNKACICEGLRAYEGLQERSGIQEVAFRDHEGTIKKKLRLALRGCIEQGQRRRDRRKRDSREGGRPFGVGTKMPEGKSEKAVQDTKQGRVPLRGNDRAVSLSERCPRVADRNRRGDT